MLTAERITRPRNVRAALWRMPWSPSLPLFLCMLALAGIALVFTAHAYVWGAWGYVDNGDGYYLYAARRLAQGAVLYRDVLGTQPPLVYLLGAAVFKLGGALTAIRVVSATMRVLATVLVFLIGRRLFDDRLTAALAALIYTLLPLGLSWDRSFDVNPPLTLVALLALWPLLRPSPGATRLGGLLAALALFTKNLYLPVLAAMLLYLALRRRRLLAPYLQGLMLGLVVLALALCWYAGPGGVRDAFLGQDSSPLNLAWFVVSLRYVGSLEGGIVLAAVAGAVMCVRAARQTGDRSCEIAPWFLAGSCAVLLATLKEGTAWPVFQLAEPAVALLAAYGAARSWRALARRLPVGVAPIRLWQTAYAALWPAILLCSLWGLVVTGRTTLAATNSAAVGRVAALIHAHAGPGTTIVAPPYYALLSGTHLPGDAADTYIVAQRERRGDRWARRLIGRVDADLAAQRIPVVLTDLRIEAIAPLMAVLRAHYRPVYADALPPALHVVVWLPSGHHTHHV